MSEPFIFNETDFQENFWDFFTNMMYKGKPFTGTLIIEGNKLEDNCLANKQIIEFKDGNAHGHCMEYHRKNGQLIVDAFYENGELLFEKNWYPNGQLAR